MIILFIIISDLKEIYFVEYYCHLYEFRLVFRTAQFSKGDVVLAILALMKIYRLTGVETPM